MKKHGEVIQFIRKEDLGSYFIPRELAEQNLNIAVITTAKRDTLLQRLFSRFSSKGIYEIATKKEVKEGERTTFEIRPLYSKTKYWTEG